MDTAASPSAATATHSQMRDETRGQERVIVAVNSLTNVKRSKRIEIALSLHEWQTTGAHEENDPAAATLRWSTQCAFTESHE